MKNKTTEEYFDTLISEIIKVGIQKMSIYGTSWTSYDPDSLLVRMLNKGKRITTIIQTKENKVGEKISGEFKEILNYGSLLCMMFENQIPLDADIDFDDVTKYRELCFQKAKDLMIKKNHDYGEAWRTMSQMNIASEIKVKIRRMRFIFTKSESPCIENVYDIMNYCAFALIHIAEGVHQDM
jgi:hypothetical protein